MRAVALRGAGEADLGIAADHRVAVVVAVRAEPPNPLGALGRGTVFGRNVVLRHPGKIRIGGKIEWVRLKAGMDKAAAFLETHRYAALKGASMAFTKMEGTTVNIKDKIAYSALQNVQSSMVRNHAAWDAAFNITVEKVLNAGCILAHSLSGGQKDTGGNAINSDWVVAQTRTLLVGEDLASADVAAIGKLVDDLGPEFRFDELFQSLRYVQDQFLLGVAGGTHGAGVVSAVAGIDGHLRKPGEAEHARRRLRFPFLGGRGGRMFKLADRRLVDLDDGDAGGLEVAELVAQGQRDLHGGVALVPRRPGR